MAQGVSVTFDPPVEVSLPSSQLCLPLPSSSYSFSVFAQTKEKKLKKENTSSLFSFSVYSVSLQIPTWHLWTSKLKTHDGTVVGCVFARSDCIVFIFSNFYLDVSFHVAVYTFA